MIWEYFNALSGVQSLMRTFTFADLRPYTVPSTQAEHFANYISMLRYTIDVKGDKFPASTMSESLIKMFVGLKSMRMASTALNYSGAIPLKPHYGGVKVKSLHGFLSAFDRGPQVSAQARLFNNQLWIDFMFLKTDLNREQAVDLTREVQAVFERASAPQVCNSSVLAWFK